MRNLTLFVALLLLIACKKDNASPQQAADSGSMNEMDGDWHLQSISSLGPMITYEPGDFILTIDTDMDLAQVENNVGSDEPIIATGEYSYSLTTDSIFIDALRYGQFLDSLDLIVTDMPELDGPMYRLIRIE